MQLNFLRPEVDLVSTCGDNFKRQILSVTWCTSVMKTCVDFDADTTVYPKHVKGNRWIIADLVKTPSASQLMIHINVLLMRSYLLISLCTPPPNYGTRIQWLVYYSKTLMKEILRQCSRKIEIQCCRTTTYQPKTVLTLVFSSLRPTNYWRKEMTQRRDKWTKKLLQ